MKQNKKHKVILMADLGDLREGFWDKDEMVETALSVENELAGLELAGVGTNLGTWLHWKPLRTNWRSWLPSQKESKKKSEESWNLSPAAQPSLPENYQ